MQVCSGESGVADSAARVRGGAGRESRRRFGRHAWDLERDSLGHGYLARKHHPVRVGEKPRRWQNVGRRRSCGLQTWGLGRLELQAPQGQGGGRSDPAGRGRAREEGRMAWGQKCHWEEKAGGRGTGPGGGSREGSAGHCVASGGPGPRGAEYPAASSQRKRLSLSPWQSTLERTAAQQGRDKALASPGGSPPCCPAEATGGAGSTAPLLSWGRSVKQLPSQLPLRRQNWLCPWPHPPASVKEEKGPFARGQGHLLPRGLALPHEELQCVSRGAG